MFYTPKRESRSMVTRNARVSIVLLLAILILFVPAMGQGKKNTSTRVNIAPCLAAAPDGSCDNFAVSLPLSEGTEVVVSRGKYSFDAWVVADSTGYDFGTISQMLQQFLGGDNVKVIKYTLK